MLPIVYAQGVHMKLIVPFIDLLAHMLDLVVAAHHLNDYCSYADLISTVFHLVVIVFKSLNS